jgi:hypothetical protein
MIALQRRVGIMALVSMGSFRTFAHAVLDSRATRVKLTWTSVRRRHALTAASATRQASAHSRVRAQTVSRVPDANRTSTNACLLRVAMEERAATALEDSRARVRLDTLACDVRLW